MDESGKATTAEALVPIITVEIIEELRRQNDEVIYVVISDWLMPGMKGDELLAKVRSTVNNVKTILLTGHIDSKAVQNIEQAGKGIKCIYKPWSEAVLVKLIKD